MCWISEKILTLVGTVIVSVVDNFNCDNGPGSNNSLMKTYILRVASFGCIKAYNSLTARSILTVMNARLTVITLSVDRNDYL